ncbi:HupE/UreJ family protein [Methylocystis sp. JR02]|uniref:HupE/UreJ family protein n=1 Tax=Methylocystis sp. JR02 TaxID=3046284 RepID=UPI0024B89AF1|nr:HupE/UreJ family protein [Methylocystis sp. JR02]MDJ0448919.1 HupE/UreJ family protein [Methylocystis sp. JR02]
MFPKLAILPACLIAALSFSTPAAAHTADISSARVVPEGESKFRVDVGVLGTDIERMFQETQAERAGVDLSPPGVLEQEIGKFIQSRVSLQNEGGVTCKSEVGSVGEDPTNPYDAKIVLHVDCAEAPGQIFYHPEKLLAAQGARGKHLFSVGEKKESDQLTEAQKRGAEPAPGQTMLFPGDAPVDLSKPLLSPWQLAPKFFAAGVEHIMTGYDHLCFLLAVVLWATRVWPVVKIVTAFTVSHSITLTLAALQLVDLPSYWVEIAIALSIIYVAVENFFTRKTEGRWRDTFAFGFIHGFGFASGLIELGVPQRAIVPALASFNLGVEAGQIGVVLVVLPLLMATDRVFNKGERSPRLVYACSAVIAVFGAYWLLARVGVVK